MEFSNIDGKVLHPLRGASYIFKDDIISFLHKNIKKNKIKISVGAQPNSSPHFATLVTIIMSFILALELKKYKNNIDVEILYEIIETAPAEEVYIDGIKYQKNLETTGNLNNNMRDYIEILMFLKNITKINYTIRKQKEFNEQPEVKNIIKKIIKNEKYLAERLDPKNNKLRFRMSCPNCGLTDKEAIRNKIYKNKIMFYCPEHGEYTLNINKDVTPLEYNSPLRNLIRALTYTTINNNKYDYEVIRVTGSDYAGFYQEELRYKLASYLGYKSEKLSMIFYAPLITDWSGAKLSKSMYVKENAYSEIPKKFLSYNNMKNELGIKGLEILYKIINSWFEKPYQLFRNYSIYYFIKEFNKYE